MFVKNSNNFVIKTTDSAHTFESIFIELSFKYKPKKCNWCYLLTSIQNYHLSGKFRGAAHEVCKLKYKVPKFFPVTFHNLSGCDSHLFIKPLGNNEDISCTPNNEENYISFTKHVIVDKFVNKEGKKVNVKLELRFIDTLRFMAASLDKLSSNLKIDQFVNLKKYDSGIQLNLLLSKGAYLYDYVDFMQKFDKTSLPPKEAFILNSQMKVLQTKTTSMLKLLGRNLI